MLNQQAREILNNICRKQYGRDYLDSLDISEKILMEFGRQLCEEQKRMIVDLQFNGSIRNDEAERCKNICDE